MKSRMGGWGGGGRGWGGGGELLDSPQFRRDGRALIFTSRGYKGRSLFHPSPFSLPPSLPLSLFPLYLPSLFLLLSLCLSFTLSPFSLPSSLPLSLFHSVSLLSSSFSPSVSLSLYLHSLFLLLSLCLSFFLSPFSLPPSLPLSSFTLSPFSLPPSLPLSLFHSHIYYLFLLSRPFFFPFPNSFHLSIFSPLLGTFTVF